MAGGITWRATNESIKIIIHGKTAKYLLLKSENNPHTRINNTELIYHYNERNIIQNEQLL